jgi:hypothetical protein
MKNEDEIKVLPFPVNKFLLFDLSTLRGAYYYRWV